MNILGKMSNYTDGISDKNYLNSHNKKKHCLNTVWNKCSENREEQLKNKLFRNLIIILQYICNHYM